MTGVTVEGDDTVTPIVAVCKVGDKGYGSFEAAVAAAVSGYTIDLLGKTHVLDSTNKIIRGKTLTIKNGTFDITGTVWGGNSIFDIDNSTVTFEDVDFICKGYSSAYGVIYTYGNGTVNLTNCDFTLDGEGYPAGGVLKGNGE